MVTLEISRTDIRLIEVNGGRITKWASSSLAPGIFEEEVVSNHQALGNAVRELMAANGIRERNVIASVSGLYSLSRIVAVVVAPQQPITEQAVLEATEAVIPVSAEETYISWQALAPGEGGQQVLVVGVPRDVMDNEVRALKAAGINPHLMDIKTLALARAVDRRDALVLSIDATSFDIIILANGIPEVLRTTAWQPDTLSLEEQTEQLISAIELTTNFYDTHHPGSPLNRATPFFVTGHLSGDAALTGHLASGLEFPVEKLSPPLEYPEHFPVSQYAVNIGLAMKAAATPKVNLGLSIRRREAPASTEISGSSIPDLNLLPRAYQAWRPSARLVYYSLSAVVLLSLLLPSYRVTTAEMGDTAAVRRRYAAINTELEKRKAEIAKRLPLQQTIDQYKSTVAMGGGFVDDLATIRRIAGELDVKLQGISHSGNSISFSCDAPDYVTFRQFLIALEKSGRFSTPVIPPEGYPYIKGGAVKLTPVPDR